MSRLIEGKTVVRETGTLIQSLAELFEDSALIDLLNKMVEMTNRKIKVEMSGYHGEKQVVDFYISKAHRNFSKAMGYSPYTDLGFRKETDGTYTIVTDNPSKTQQVVQEKYINKIVQKLAKVNNLGIKRQTIGDQQKIILYR